MDDRRGGIYLITGPMHGGKTTELMRRLRREHLAGRKVLAIKWAKDDRYGKQPELVTHDKCTFPARLAHELMPHLPEIELEGYEVIGVDEGQFFPDLVEFCAQVADVLRRKVHVAALNGNFRRLGFATVTDLYSYTDDVCLFSAVCQREGCGADAPFSHLVPEAKDSLAYRNGQAPVVDAKWESLCRLHFNEANK